MLDWEYIYRPQEINHTFIHKSQDSQQHLNPACVHVYIPAQASGNHICNVTNQEGAGSHMRHDNMKCTATSKYPMKGWLKTVMIFTRQKFKTINPESNLPIILLANQASQVRCWRCDERVACDCHHWWSCLINEMMSITDDYDDDDGGNEFISPSLTLSVLASRLGRVSWSFIRYIFWDECLWLVRF